ncbi:MAG: SDR family NAD(P)-dependent oxidoreductase [Lewinellaceae bacterium]|nr:SDR family NAD(P)-dependent oxidoreductase [Lewinellaceae bacterium]
MKSILVTGAAGNMGRAVVSRFLTDGHTIHATLGHGHDAPQFETTSGAGQLFTAPVDLMDAAASESFIKGIIARGQSIDAAVCMVGGWQSGSLAETTMQDLDKMFKLNFATAFNIARPLLEFFEKQGHGQFVFIGARPAINPADGKNQVAYALSKALVFHLAEIINEQGKGKNISAGVLVPSILDTPQNRAAMPDANAADWVTPEAAADSIAFLLSETGEKLRQTVLKLYNNA